LSGIAALSLAAQGGNFDDLVDRKRLGGDAAAHVKGTLSSPSDFCP
jgi:hypothetical protein